MNYTENYHLPQWEESDRVMMKDFNQMCASIDEGIGAAAEKPYVFGTYYGKGTISHDVEIGFRPSLLLVFCNQYAGTYTKAIGTIAAVGPRVDCTLLTLTDTGFHVGELPNDITYPQVNRSGTLYQYVAFR